MQPETDPTHLLPTLVRPNLDLIIVGAAPSREAAATGHYYAGRRNRFWQLLHASGFTPTELAPAEDHRVLEFGIGLLPILPYCISVQNDQLPPPTPQDRERVLRILTENPPLVVAFNGRDVYRMLFETEPVWGQQKPEPGQPPHFVVHSSSGRADRWAQDRLFLWKQLKAIVEEQKDRTKARLQT